MAILQYKILISFLLGKLDSDPDWINSEKNILQ